MIKLMVDGREIDTPEGVSVLQACLRNEIYIPHLCFLEGESDPEASCRLCFVEIEGRSGPVASCTEPVTGGLKVQTNTPAVRHLQRSALRLLLSAHPLDCRHCHANRACALQSMARFLDIGLKPDPLAAIPRTVEVDRSHPCLDLYPHRCVLCGKCIKVCRDYMQHPLLTLAGRGIHTSVRYYGASGVQAIDCRSCGRCAAVCPVGAIQLKNDGQGVKNSPAH